jgi:hypothetical protein
MQLAARPVGRLNTSRRASDVAELSLGITGLRVVVHVGSSDSDEQLNVEYLFDVPRGFRFLDEGDLLRYWAAGVFSVDHQLFEILSGGWMDQECKFPGMLSVTNAVGSFREWFICTSNGCINVLSVDEPLIREFA